jgi:CheY-like chemotaxis protein
LVRRTVEICRGDLEAKRLNLRLEFNAADDTAMADPARLQQVLWNLVKNAVKFTPEAGTIRVTTRAEGGRLEVEVADTGVGIEPSALPRIFNAFEQADDATARRFGGLGLGLAISRSIAEAHGGTLTASSAGKDHGATLLLELPAAQAAPESGPNGATGQGESLGVRPPGPGPLRLLFVEDDPMTGRIMARLLRLAGHQVTTAGTLADAICAASERFDLVVSDIGLPDGSGLDLMRHIRTRFDTPGIALSGFGMEDDVRRCRDAGFVAHLTKPIDFGKLDAVIRRVVTTRSTSSAAG